MTDDLDKHIGRIKTEKGAEWADNFDTEYQRFVNCVLLSQAMNLLGMVPAAVARGARVPEPLISKIVEQHDTSVPSEVHLQLSNYLKEKLRATCAKECLPASTRFGDLVALCRSSRKFAMEV